MNKILLCSFKDDVNKNKDDDYDIQKVEIKHEAKKTKSNPKMKKAIACTKKNCDDEGNCKEVRDGTENKHVNKNVSQHLDILCIFSVYNGLQYQNLGFGE